jgi:hypothetical protein
MTNDKWRKKPESTKSESAGGDWWFPLGIRIWEFFCHLTFGFRHYPTSLPEKNPKARSTADFKTRRWPSAWVTVVADGLDRAAFLGFFALRLLFGRARLFIDKGIAAVIVAFEIVGSGFATEVAVDALVIDVEFSRDVLGVSVCGISHNLCC